MAELADGTQLTVGMPSSATVNIADNDGMRTSLLKLYSTEYLFCLLTYRCGSVYEHGYLRL